MQDFSQAEIKAARKKGVLESELIPYLQRKREGPEKINLDQPRVIVSNPPQAKQGAVSGGACINGGFEMGNFSNWGGSYGTTPQSGVINLNSFTPGFSFFSNPVTSRHSIMPVSGWPAPWQGPVDPIVGTPAGKKPIPIPVFPNGGNHMLRLGSPDVNNGAETAEYYFQVNAANSDFRFRYGLVMQDPTNHLRGDKPFFQYMLFDMNGSFGPQLIDFLGVVADVNAPFFESTPNADGYLVWGVSCHRKDLSLYHGHLMRAIFFTADCRLGGHFGYAYIDGLCETDFNKPILTLADEYCLGKPILADASQTQGETKYTWSVVETDASGNNPVSGTQASETFPGKIKVPKDLRVWYSAKGKTWKCGSYYRVTLKIDTECSNGDETSKVIRISCPPVPVITGPGSTCQTGTYSVNPEPGTTYNWIIGNGVASPTTGPSTTVTWSTPNAGNVIVSATNACGSKAVILKVPACKDKCCNGVKPSTQGGTLQPLGGGAYTFNPILKAGPPNQFKVTATILSTSISYPSLLCGVSGPANSYIRASNLLPPFLPPSLAVADSREIVWTSANAAGVYMPGGRVFPFKIQFPPGPGPNCTDIVTFCVKYTFTDINCNTCDLVVCYSFQRFPLINGFEPSPQLVSGGAIPGK
ncbi:MAG TPA: hypothetical protein VLL54_08175 [Pyrinomonadaceae bacterium]|nr:hypothetical protein [Pyrinomonadaceae bacterium]